ncbi:hypothetical protein [Fodinicurvata sp. EGI_FJ10296]|uniref:hypothetical protein n=1 Tax=Fodinicurvata sp. EGI_FJ10296 TaxID=3231908 RepID=UPI0034530699
MARIPTGAAAAAALVFVLSMGGQGPQPAAAYEPPDPQAMTGAATPAFDPEAEHGGRTALEHAERLDSPMMMQQLRTLEDLGAMGVDALPARGAVRSLVTRTEHADFSANQIEEVALHALAVLMRMEAPEATDLLREKLIDPDFGTHDRTHETLLQLAVNAGPDTATLRGDLLAVAASDPEHAARLMAIGILPDGVQSALEAAVYERGHGDDATRHFLTRLADLPFLRDRERLGYVRDHRALAAENAPEVAAMLAALGSAEALDVALSLDGVDEVRRYNLMTEFARGPMGADQAAARLVREGRGAASDRDIGAVATALEVIARDLAAGVDAHDQDPGAAHALFARSMAALIEERPTPEHALVGIDRQITYLHRNPDAGAAALDPVFDLIADGDAPAEIREQAANAVSRTPERLAERDPDYFAGRTVELLWQGRTPAQTAMPENVLLALVRSPDHAGAVIEAIAEGYAAHADTWAASSAAAVVLSSGNTAGLDHSPPRETAGILMGRVLANPATDFGHIDRYLRRGGGAGTLSDLGHNTVAGVIGTLEPTIFADGQRVRLPFPPEVLAVFLDQRPRWLADDPAAEDQWREFLQRVADLDDPAFSDTARQALQEF